MSTNPSATTAPVLTTKGRFARLVGWCVLAAVFLLCYGGTLRGLVADWWVDPDYSFGLVAPLAVGYIVFSRRAWLLKHEPAPNVLAGLSVIVASQAMFLVGNLAADFFLERSSIVLLAAGAILYLAGWAWLRPLLLPLFLFELCIPLPAILLHQVSMSLQLISSSAAGTILRGCGIPVFRSGNILQLPHRSLNVVEACSGLRSLASMIALALLLISPSRLAWWARTAFVVSAAVVAVAANALRISASGLLAEYVGSHAISGGWHLLEGWFVFVVAFALLSAELAILRRLPGVAQGEEGQP